MSEARKEVAHAAFDAWATEQWGHSGRAPHTAWLGFQAGMAAAAVTTWQPMETAPKHSRILAVVDGLVRVVLWGKTSHVPIYGFCLADQGAEDFDICEPTHWMPLPAAPAQGEQQ